MGEIAKIHDAVWDGQPLVSGVSYGGGFPKNGFRNPGKSTHGVFPLFSSMACIHIMGNQALLLR